MDGWHCQILQWYGCLLVCKLIKFMNLQVNLWFMFTVLKYMIKRSKVCINLQINSNIVKQKVNKSLLNCEQCSSHWSGPNSSVWSLSNDWNIQWNRTVNWVVNADTHFFYCPEIEKNIQNKNCRRTQSEKYRMFFLFFSITKMGHKWKRVLVKDHRDIPHNSLFSFLHIDC